MGEDARLAFNASKNGALIEGPLIEGPLLIERPIKYNERKPPRDRLKPNALSSSF